MNPAPPVTRTALGSPEVDNTARIMANRTQDPSPAVALDVTPLQNANRVRGIGTYVRGLANRLAAQDEVAIEFWGWQDDLPLEIRPPHRAVLMKRSVMPEYRGKWLFAQLAMQRRARASSVRAVHITDPDALTPLPEELLIAGHWLPKQVAALNARVSASGLAARVRHIGFVPDGELAVRLRDATAVVIPSRSEGFGLPVAEGLAAGALVVHSRIPVLEDTSAGAALTFDPDSAEQLAESLRRASAGGADTRELRERGLRRAKDLTWDEAVRATIDSYREALAS